MYKNYTKEFCISRQLCEKNKSGKTNISSDKEKH